MVGCDRGTPCPFIGRTEAPLRTGAATAAALFLLLGALGGCDSHADEQADVGISARTPDARVCGSACADAAAAKCTHPGCDGTNADGTMTPVSPSARSDAGSTPAPPQRDASSEAGLPHRDAATDSELPPTAGVARCTPANPAGVACSCGMDFATESAQFAETCGSPPMAPHSGQPVLCGAYQGLYFQGIDTSKVVLYDRKTGGLAGMMEVGADAVVHCYSFAPGFTTPLDVFGASSTACVSACPAQAGSPGNTSCQANSSDVSHSPPTLGGPACITDLQQCADSRTYRAFCSYEAGDGGALRIRCDCLVNGLDSASYFFANTCPVDRADVDAGCGWKL